MSFLINFLSLLMSFVCQSKKRYGFGALSGKMLLVRIVENNTIVTYFRAG